MLHVTVFSYTDPDSTGRPKRQILVTEWTVHDVQIDESMLIMHNKSYTIYQFEKK